MSQYFMMHVLLQSRWGEEEDDSGSSEIAWYAAIFITEAALFRAWQEF